MKTNDLSTVMSLAILLVLAAAAPGIEITVHNSPAKSGGSSASVTTSHGESTSADAPTDRKKQKDTYPGGLKTGQYGKGETLRSKSRADSFRKTRTIDEHANGHSQYEHELARGETRSRTYLIDEERAVGIGAQAQHSLVRERVEVADESTWKHGDVELANLKSKASAEAFVGVQGDAGAEIDLNGNPEAKIGVAGFAGVREDVNASTKGRVLGADVEAEGHAYGAVGVGANAGAEVSKDGAKAGVGAFAGAQYGASGSANVAGAKASGEAEVWAGVGLKAERELSVKNGKLTVGANVGAAVGVGGAVGGSTTIDYAEAGKNVVRVGKTTGRLVDQEIVHRYATKVPRQIKSPRAISGSRWSSGLVGPAAINKKLSPVRVKAPKFQALRIKAPKIKQPRVKPIRVKKPSIKPIKIKKPKIKKLFK